jgi:hypothetical protein
VDEPVGTYDKGNRMNWKRIGNVSAGVLFLAAALWSFNRDTSGTGAVFLTFAAVFLGLGLFGGKRA